MSLVETLREQRQAWEERPLVRRLYADWFSLVKARLAGGPTIELGSGIGTFAEFVPDAVRTDVEPTPWADAVVDAEAMPYEDGTVGNLVLVDVFHHLPSPARFLDEASRVLRPGGRVVILDPYCSPVSTRAYRLLHHERTDLEAPAFDEDPALAGVAMEGNQARARLAFFDAEQELARRWPGLALVERRRLSLLVYPLSGGFSKPPLVPVRLYGLLSAFERLLAPLAPFLAFRCLVVLERRS